MPTTQLSLPSPSTGKPSVLRLQRDLSLAPLILLSVPAGSLDALIDRLLGGLELESSRTKFANASKDGVLPAHTEVPVFLGAADAPPTPQHGLGALYALKGLGHAHLPVLADEGASKWLCANAGASAELPFGWLLL